MSSRPLISACALKLFAERGYDAVGVQEIVDAAGITKPSLYHHFGSKRGLLEALIAPLFQEVNEALAHAASYHHDLPQNLDQAAACFFSFAEKQPLFSRLMLSMIHAPIKSEARLVVQPWLEEQYRTFETLFRLASGDHGNMKGRSNPFAATFLGMLHTYVSLFLDGNTGLDDRVRREAVRQFSHGIYS